MASEDFPSAAVKQALEEMEDELDAMKDGGDASQARSGRVRKKSAKLIEMEETDEFEKVVIAAKAPAAKLALKRKAPDSLFSRLSPKSSTFLSQGAFSGDHASVQCDSDTPPRGDYSPQGAGSCAVPTVVMETCEPLPLQVVGFKEPLPLAAGDLSPSCLEPPAKKARMKLSPCGGLLQDDDKEGLKAIVSAIQMAESVGRQAGGKAGTKKKSVTIAEPPSTLAGDDAAWQIEDDFDVKTEFVKEEELSESTESGEEDSLPLVIDSPPTHTPTKKVTSTKATDALLQLQKSVNLQKKKRKVLGKKGLKLKEKKEPKEKRPMSAYQLWCCDFRPRLVSVEPQLDFSSINRRLGEIWCTLAEKEKLSWKKKATKHAKQTGRLLSSSKRPTLKPAKRPATKPAPETPEPAGRGPTTPETYMYKVVGTSEVDAAAHLKLLGESLSIIGVRLNEHQGQIAVAGSLSVLLDSLLCALAPLVTLTNQIPELAGANTASHSETLDNIAYFMPGIG